MPALKIKTASGYVVVARGPQGATGATGPQGPPGPSTGPAGGDLTGTYPNPLVANGAISDSKVAASNIDGIATTASMRTLGTGAQQAAAGNHTHALGYIFVRGAGAFSTNSGGQVTITHNGGFPAGYTAFCQVASHYASPCFAIVENKNTNSMTIRIYNAGGTDLVSATRTLEWMATNQ